MDERTADYFLRARMKRPELFDQGEQELRKLLVIYGQKDPSITENQLRLKFWYEYELVMASSPVRKMSVAALCRGTCSTDLFYNYIRKAESAAWIACAPVTYESHLLEMLSFGAHRMREIMQARSINPDGTVNVKLAELQAKLYHAAELRAHGAIPQTVQTLNYNLNDPRAVGKAVEGRTNVLLEDKIAQLERDSKKLAKDVTPVEK